MKLLDCNKVDALQIASQILNFNCYEITYENKSTDVEFLPSNDNAIHLALKEHHWISKIQFYFDGIGYMQKNIIIDDGKITNVSVQAIENLTELINDIIFQSVDDTKYKEYDDDEDEIESLSAHIFNISNEQIAYVNPME